MDHDTMPDFTELFADGVQWLAKAQDQTAGWVAHAIPEDLLPGMARMTELFETSTPVGASQRPYFDTVFGVDRKYIAFLEAGTALLQANTEYQFLLGKTWMEAWQRYSIGAGEVAGEREVSFDWTRLGSTRELVDQWFDFANSSLLQWQRTQEFLEAQRKLVNAITEFRIRHREIMEIYQEQNHAPTRTEVDDLSRSVYELKRELRTLKRARNEANQPLKEAS